MLPGVLPSFQVIVTADCYSIWNVVLVFKCFRMHKMFILLSILVATVCGKSVPLLKPMSQEMIDFINSEAQTTWKVCV